MTLANSQINSRDSIWLESDWAYPSPKYRAWV